MFLSFLIKKFDFQKIIIASLVSANTFFDLRRGLKFGDEPFLFVLIASYLLIFLIFVIADQFYVLSNIYIYAAPFPQTGIWHKINLYAVY